MVWEVAGSDGGGVMENKRLGVPSQGGILDENQ